WLLHAKGQSLMTPVVDSTAWPAWLKQPTQYTPPAVPTPTPVTAPPDQTVAQLAALRAQLLAQQQAIEELQRRGVPMALKPQAPATAPPPKTPGPMLFVSHDLPQAGTPSARPDAYTLAPGATKLPCIVETAINSDVEGYFTAKVSANVYDTAS